MVNYGVSRGCGTCRERKKKCDQTRPMCKTCVRSNRECLGYKSDTDLIFRNGMPSKAAIHTRPRPTKPRNRLVELNPRDATDQELESLALEFFLQDFCVKPVDVGLSRGYLQRVAAEIRDRGPASRVAKTARLVSLEGIGRRWKRPSIRQRARQLYQDELLSFQSRMSDETVLRSEETLMIITMFGLYEIMSTPSPDEGDHMVHALGITALLRTHNSPLGLVADFARGSLNGFMERGLLNPPNAAGGPAEESLDNMTLELFSVFTEYEVLLGKMRAAGPPDPWRLRRLFRETQGGFDKIMQWQRTQRILDPAQFAGIAGDSLVERAHGCVFWPGRIDVYKDLWIASVWLIHRKACVRFAQIVAECAAHLQVDADDDIVATAARMKEEIQPTITDVLASVPFFLLKNVKHAFSFSEQPKPLHPGPPVGGLLAMHPLFMLTEMDRVVRPDMIRYLRACLNWMDEWQGIGQARWLGQGQPGPFRSIADAHTIVWAGMAM